MLTISRIKAFKACRRKYELKYIEGLEPVEKPTALEVGTNYHELLEFLNKGGDLAGNPDYAGIYTKELAMARAYEKFIQPHFKCEAVEKWVEHTFTDGSKMIGRVDGIATDGCLVEHKSCGSDIGEAYEYNLLWDEQILAYMLMTGTRKVHYTVCRKPTIRQKQNETDEEFFYRMLDWYETDTDSKIRLFDVERTDEEVEAFRKELEEIKDIISEAEVNKRFYRNTCHCNAWGRRCEYSSICLNYDPSQEYIEFTKAE